MSEDARSTTDTEPTTNEQQILMECECGKELSTTENDSRLSCECGVVYMITVTQLR